MLQRLSYSDENEPQIASDGAECLELRIGRNFSGLGKTYCNESQKYICEDLSEYDANNQVLSLEDIVALAQ